MQADGRAWACDVDALSKVRDARRSGASNSLSALRSAEASLTEMVRDRRATSGDVTALAAVRCAIQMNEQECTMAVGVQASTPVEFESVKIGDWFKEQVHGSWHLKVSPSRGVYQSWGTTYEPFFASGETVFVERQVNS